MSQSAYSHAQEEKKSGNLVAASEAFKKFILSETAAFASEPEADLFRVQTLGQMLDQCDELLEQGVPLETAVLRVKRQFSELEAQMRAQGFSEKEDVEFSRWPKLTEDEVSEYIRELSNQHHHVALGAALCTACCIPLMVFLSVSELFSSYLIEEFASMLGVVGLFGMVALGVYAILTGKKPKMDSKIRKKQFSLGAKLRRKLKDLEGAIKEKARRRLARGVALEVLCVAPVILGSMLGSLFGVEDFGSLLGVGGMFAMIALGVYDIVMANNEKSGISKLLKNEDK